jgi:hypothetical protein
VFLFYNAVKDCQALTRGKTIRTGGEHEVGFTQPADTMCPDRDRSLTPGQTDLGMVVNLFSHLADFVCEIKRLLKIIECVGFLQALIVYDLPVMI